MTRLIGAVAILAVVAVGLYAPHAPVLAYQGGNLLQNPGFEEPYVAMNGDSTLRVASNWQPWSLPQGATSSINVRPEYSPRQPGAQRSGGINTFFATHTGGMYQRVPVTPNTHKTASSSMSGRHHSPTDVSDDPNDVSVRWHRSTGGWTAPARISSGRHLPSLRPVPRAFGSATSSVQQ
jgi:hypothetical protein